MLEAAVCDRPKYLGLQQKVAEARAVDGHVRALQALLLGGRLGRLHRRLLRVLLVLVVQKIVSVRHFAVAQANNASLITERTKLGTENGKEATKITSQEYALGLMV